MFNYSEKERELTVKLFEGKITREQFEHKLNVLQKYSARLQAREEAHKERVKQYYNMGSIVVNGVLVKASYAFIKKFGKEHGGFIFVPEGTKTIKKGVFYDCNDLHRLYMANEVEHIQDEAFAYCSNLEWVNFLSKIKTFGNHAFYACNLKGKLNLKNAQKIGDFAFYRNDSLKTVKFSEDLQSIGNGAFYDCKSLQGVLVIPEHTKSIGDEAFYGTAIKEVLVPNDCKLGYNSFPADCKISEYIIETSDDFETSDDNEIDDEDYEENEMYSSLAGFKLVLDGKVYDLSNVEDITSLKNLDSNIEIEGQITVEDLLADAEQKAIEDEIGNGSMMESQNSDDVDDYEDDENNYEDDEDDSEEKDEPTSYERVKDLFDLFYQEEINEDELKNGLSAVINDEREHGVSLQEADSLKEFIKEKHNQVEMWIAEDKINEEEAEADRKRIEASMMDSEEAAKMAEEEARRAEVNSALDSVQEYVNEIDFSGNKFKNYYNSSNSDNSDSRDM